MSITGHPVIQRQITNFQDLCDALAHFETPASPWTDPLEWTRLNTQHLSDIADKFLGTQSVFDGVFVYPVRSNALAVGYSILGLHVHVFPVYAVSSGFFFLVPLHSPHPYLQQTINTFLLTQEDIVSCLW